MYGDNKKKFYPYNGEHGKVKYVYVFKYNDLLEKFKQVDNESHEFLGKSKYGIAIQGCIKIEFAEDSARVEDATWSWEIPM